ncbi:MAG: nucleoside hydrolase [Actinobacteria bacterium]|nr:nucleoside hydrolase [Actinomycetota bacterium]
MARKIILDCDPGHDDALALLLAHAHPAIDLLAVTTVAGNQTLDKTTLNALRVMSVAGIKEVPVAAGAERPLMRDQVTAPEVHGESGLEGWPFEEPEVSLDSRHAVDLIADTVTAAEQVTLVPVGPLTNIALALHRHPVAMKQVKEIVLMGGSSGLGNTTPAAEFNIHADPEAAHIVFSSGIPVTMVPLDLTHQAMVTPQILERMRAVGNPVADMAAALLGFYTQAIRDAKGFSGAALHDPCAVARVIRPEIIDCTRVNIVVETAQSWSYGATVCDLEGVTGRQPNALIAQDLDADAFWDLMIDALAGYS